MPEDPIGRLLVPGERPVHPRPEFREELWERLVQEADRRPAPSWPGGPSPWHRSGVRRVLTIAAALLLGVAAVAIVLPLGGGRVNTIGDIPAFGPMPGLRATIERQIPRASVQELVDAIAAERAMEAPIVREDQVIRLRLTSLGESWRIDWVSDSLQDGSDAAVGRMLSELSPDRRPGSYWLGGSEPGVYSASTSTFTPGPPAGDAHPLDLLSWDATAAADAHWSDACSTDTPVETQIVAGRDAHRFACGPWDLWVDAAQGLLLRLQLHDPAGLGVPVPGVIGMVSGETLEVMEVEFGTALDAAEFRPPEGATVDGQPDGPQQATDLEIGDPVPAPTLEHVDGSRFDLSTPDGRRALYLWASWCPPCLGPGGERPEVLEAMNEVARGLGDELLVVAVASGDDPAAAKRLTAELDALTSLLDPDGELHVPLGSSRGIPLLVLVEPDGTLAGAYLGGLTPAQAEEILDAFAHGTELPAVGGQVVSQVP